MKAVVFVSIMTMMIIEEEVKIACLLTPITPATIKQITIEDNAGR